jgi:hypothetical protein
LYDFPSAPSIVHLEHHRSGAFVYDGDDVTAYKAAADMVRNAAMNSAESTGFIAKVLAEMELEKT